MAIYVETLVRAGLDPLRRHTQEPALHARWDARFTRIEGPGGHGGQRRFRYVTRVFPGVAIAGVGSSTSGRATSALRFRCDDRRSLIAAGAGYWRYVPTPEGVRFLTGYDYVPRWGRAGRLADRLFRPLFGWATAWSFDRLRLWLDRGIPPRRSLAIALAEVAVRSAAVAAALPLGAGAAVPVAALAVLVPPSPFTPAARRCLRRPPDRLARAEPVSLTALEAP